MPTDQKRMPPEVDAKITGDDRPRAATGEEGMTKPTYWYLTAYGKYVVRYNNECTKMLHGKPACVYCDPQARGEKPPCYAVTPESRAVIRLKGYEICNE
jgi:hypothetical protein